MGPLQPHHSFCIRALHSTSDMGRLVLLSLLCALVAASAVSAFETEQELREYHHELELRGWWANLKDKAAGGWNKLKGWVGGLTDKIMAKGKAFGKEIWPKVVAEAKSCAKKLGKREFVETSMHMERALQDVQDEIAALREEDFHNEEMKRGLGSKIKGLLSKAKEQCLPGIVGVIKGELKGQ